MIPLRDSVPHRRAATVTLLLILACVLVFLYELTLSQAALDRFVHAYGARPSLVLGALAGDPGVPRTALVTLITSQFLHAGWLHLLGNMVFLWVFGRAVEERLGHALYLVVYLAVGALAGLAQAVIGGSDSAPLIGASGAIAGVLGAYFISFPRAWVTILVPIFFFFWTFDLPAILVLAFWFLSQFFNGVAAITQASHTTSGVAVWAHVAGFLIGLVVARLAPMPARGWSTGSTSPLPRRANVPGPARLISSVADLLSLLLVARLIIVLIGWEGFRSPLPFITGTVLMVTRPLVLPFADVIPAVRLGGSILETYTIVAIVAVYLLASLLGRLVVRR